MPDKKEGSKMTDREKDNQKSDKEKDNQKPDKEKDSKMTDKEDDKKEEVSPSVKRPPRRPSKITLPISSKIPQFYKPPPGMVTIPLTPATGLPQNYPINFGIHDYHTKVQEFMFKQIKDVKNIGLSFGEKFALWMYGQFRGLSSKTGFSHIFLFIVICLYCIIGGIILYYAEKEEKEVKNKKDLELLRNITDSIYNGLEGNKTNINKTIIQIQVLTLANTIRPNYTINDWGLINSMYLCGTIFTTIGYGHIAPATTTGKVITIIYSLFGIPLFLILLADYGKLFTRGIKYLWNFVRRVYYRGRKVGKTDGVQKMVKGAQVVINMTMRRPSTINNETAEPKYPCRISPAGTPAMSSYIVDDEFNLPISIAFAILLMYMCCGAFLFSYFEKDWNFWKSFYFVYISMSTIGFGDIVPQGQVFMLLTTLVYFIFGLSLTSMCINVVQEKISASFKQATNKIGSAMGLEVTEVSGAEDDETTNPSAVNQTLEPIPESA